MEHVQTLKAVNPGPAHIVELQMDTPSGVILVAGIFHDENDPRRLSHAQAIGLADLIVNAVNNHERLVDENASLLTALIDTGVGSADCQCADMPEGEMCVPCEVRAAIAKATQID